MVADVQQFVERIDTMSDNKIIKNVGNLEKDVSIANVPVMLKSKFCSINIKQNLKGECRIDPGGYFIVNGAEKI